MPEPTIMDVTYSDGDDNGGNNDTDVYNDTPFKIYCSILWCSDESWEIAAAAAARTFCTEHVKTERTYTEYV